MKKKLILFVILFYSLISKAQTFEQSLNSDKVQWKFYCTTPSPLETAGVRLGQKFPAKVPGTIHLDLLDNKLIPDPFYADNEKRLQWIDTLDWVYETTFDVDSNLFKQQHIELQFDGLDTYADVYLNDERLSNDLIFNPRKFSSDNMFLQWKNNNVKGDLILKNNHLKIIFHSTLKEAKKLKAQFEKEHGYELPEGERVFVRKAQYQFGWDFAPKFLGCGIWKGAKIIGWNNIILRNIWVETLSNKDVDSAIVELNLGIEERHEILCPRKGPIILNYELNGQKDTINSSRITSVGGYQINNFRITIKKPKLWWCNGEGVSNMYKLKLNISTFAWDTNFYNVSLDTLIQFAIKKYEFVQQKDSIGESFYFKLNGKPVFIKGANWVPADVFLPRVSHEKYRHLLIAAKDVGMNMLRVWGGGIYEDEYFYHLCDSLGIMVWQDLMFACAMYPTEDSIPLVDVMTGNMIKMDKYPNNSRYEYSENYSFSKTNYALVCGNNEINEGWKNWGWQKSYNYSSKDSTNIIKSYVDAFEITIPETMRNDIPYIPSSPKFGWGHKESLTDGDSHYWGVWWGMEPYEIYKKRVPRFASEYGMQSLPCLETIRKFAPDSSLRINSVAMRNHQKHPTGFENLDGYLKYYGFKVNGGLVKGRKVIPEYGKGNPDAMDSTWSAKNYPNPTIKEFEDYINATQQLQADALRTAIEAHMKAQPRCMGTILWQLNEPWPGASWSLIDYYGNKKKAYYEVQKLFKEKK